MSIGKAKVGKLSMGEAFGVAFTKVVSENALSKVIGNGTFMSGAIKIGLAIGTQKVVGGKWGDILGTALVVDGTEDILTPLIAGGLGGITGAIGIGNSGNVQVI